TVNLYANSHMVSTTEITGSERATITVEAVDAALHRKRAANANLLLNTMSVFNLISGAGSLTSTISNGISLALFKNEQSPEWAKILSVVIGPATAGLFGGG